MRVRGLLAVIIALALAVLSESRSSRSSLNYALSIAVCRTRRRSVPAIKSEIGVQLARLKRSPCVEQLARSLQAIACLPEGTDSTFHWVFQASALLDAAWWQKKAGPTGITEAKRQLLARASGALLTKIAFWPQCLHFAACVAQLGSRANELLRRAAANKIADSLFERLNYSVPWVSHWQTPIRFVRGLLSRPIWTATDLIADKPSAVSEIVQALRKGFPRILKDLARIRSRRWPAAYGPELISQPHNWTKMLLYDGDIAGAAPAGFPGEPYQRRELHKGLCATYAPETCSILQKLLPGLRHPDLPYLQKDHEQVAFFHLAPGSQIEFHQASQNARLTIHLCLEGCGGKSFLQVGPHVLRWRRGHVFVFDDSYLHRVSIDPNRSRWILHVMAAHPGIGTPSKFASAIEHRRLWPDAA